MPRGPIVALALVGVLMLLGLGFAVEGSRPLTHDDQIRSVATTLRCPVCAGENVADSAAPLAESMRLVIGEQLDQGRSPGEIRAWFAQTYGDDVLLAPPARGAGWVMWVVPLVVLGLAGVLLARRWLPGRGRGAAWRAGLAGVAAAVVVLGIWLVPAANDGGTAEGAANDPVPPGSLGAEAPLTGADGIPDPLAAEGAPLGVLREGVAELPGSAPLRATLASRLEGTGEYEGAAQQYTALVRLRPLDPDVRYREAFALLRSGDTQRARASLQGALELQDDHPETLLLLGSLEQTADPDEGHRLLTRFLEAAPDHPQADQVRDWLAEREEDA